MALFKGGSHPPIRMPEKFSWFLDRAISEIESYIHSDEYKVGSPNYLKGFAIDVGSIRARCQESIGNRGQSSFALRLSSDEAPEFDNLGLPSAIQEALMNPDMQRKGGLISIFGAQNCGKTWTAYAALIAYLKRYGGSGYTIEDPIEFDIAGWVGEKGGYITQSDCTKIGYARAVENSLRFPRSILFIGEIRDPKAAAEMLRISVGGQLVIVTSHAKNHQSMCQRIISMAHEGGEQQASSLLANSLQLSIRQEITNGVLQASMLQAHNDVRMAIEKGDYTAFAHAAERQAMELKSSTAHRLGTR